MENFFLRLLISCNYQVYTRFESTYRLFPLINIVYRFRSTFYKPDLLFVYEIGVAYVDDLEVFMYYSRGSTENRIRYTVRFSTGYFYHRLCWNLHNADSVFSDVGVFNDCDFANFLFKECDLCGVAGTDNYEFKYNGITCTLGYQYKVSGIVSKSGIMSKYLVGV